MTYDCWLIDLLVISWGCTCMSALKVYLKLYAIEDSVFNFLCLILLDNLDIKSFFKI